MPKQLYSRSPQSHMQTVRHNRSKQMRDKNRIPEILQELERVWRDNPDFRLGQLITVAARPSSPHPTTFYIEDDKMLEGFKTLGQIRNIDETTEQIWKKNDVIGKTNNEST